jgi:hypothetical protein
MTSYSSQIEIALQAMRACEENGIILSMNDPCLAYKYVDDSTILGCIKENEPNVRIGAMLIQDIDNPIIFVLHYQVNDAEPKMILQKEVTETEAREIIEFTLIQKGDIVSGVTYEKIF